MDNNLNSLLHKVTISLAAYLEKILPSLFNDWWNESVVNKLSWQQGKRVKEQGINSLTSLDLAALLRVLDKNWYQISTKQNLRSEARNFVKEMRTVRNRWAHAGSEEFPVDDVYRDLDTLQRFAKVIEADESLLQEVRATMTSLHAKGLPITVQGEAVEKKSSPVTGDRGVKFKPGKIVIIDPSCPKCKHLNKNLDMEFCTKCKSSIEKLFRTCPNCGRRNRIDIDDCRGCGFTVGYHFKILELMQRAEVLRYEDPLETIGILENVMRLDSGQERARSLLLDLRKKQDKVIELISEAERASQNGNLEKALEKWQAVLKIIPRHTIASKQANQLEGILTNYRKNHERAMNLMDEAQFDKAEALIQKCVKLIPSSNESRKLLEKCYERSDKYNRAMEKANAALSDKLLKDVEKHLKVAFSHAPSSPDALTLSKKISANIEKVSKLLKQAKSQLASTEFKKSKDLAEQIKKIQPNAGGIMELIKDIALTQKGYLKSMKEANQAKSECDLNRAETKVKSALKYCNKSSDAKAFFNVVKKDKEGVQKLLKGITTAVKAGKLSEAEIKIKKVNKLWSKAKGLKTLQRKIHTSKTLKLIEKAEKNILKSEFEKAKTIVEKLTEIQAEKKILAKLKKDIFRVEKRYSEAIEEAVQEKSEDNFEKAEKKAKAALRYCPDSSEAKMLYSTIKRELKWKEDEEREREAEEERKREEEAERRRLEEKRRKKEEEEHHRRNHCAECDSKLPEEFLTSKSITSSIGEKLRFCKETCVNEYRLKNLCGECREKITGSPWTNEDVTASFGKKLRFCSKSCIGEFKRKHFCAWCNSRLGKGYRHNERINSAFSEEKRFCGSLFSSCLENYGKDNLCAACHSKIEEPFKYCKECGYPPKYCSDYCYKEHKCGACFATTAICVSLSKSDDCEELNILRWFRDTWLREHNPEAIQEYYRIAPSIVHCISQRKDSSAIWEELYFNYILRCIDDIKGYRYEKAFKRYREMVRYVIRQYVHPGRK